MKLQNVPDESIIKLLENPTVPIGAYELKKGDQVLFHKIDGMYSYCHYYPENKKDNGVIVRPVAWTEVEIIK